MDNFEFHINCIGKETFFKAMELACIYHSKIVGYQVHEKYGLILYWSKSEKKGFVEYPFIMNPIQAAEFAFGWLEQNPPKESQPDHDGDNDRGWVIANETWGHVDGEWQAFIHIKATWAMYGK